MMATIMYGESGSLDLEEPKEEKEDCVVQTVMPTEEDGAAATLVVAEDPFGDEQGDNDIAASAAPSRHLSTSSDGSSVEIGVGEEVS